MHPRGQALFGIFFALALGCTTATEPRGQAGTSDSGPMELGKYVLLDTMTDDAKQEKCKANVEDTLVKNQGHVDELCLVGLWAYNPPAMLSAVKGANLEGTVQMVAFDENEDTLQGIADGHIHGTIVQQPFYFGYHAIRMLAAVARGDESQVPESGVLPIEHRVIKQNRVDAFRAELAKLKDPPAGKTVNVDTSEWEGRGGDTTKPVKLAFITNNPFEFWTFARRGCEKAAEDFSVELEFHMPPHGTADEQRRIIEDLLAKGIDGIAISVNDAANQAAFLDGVAEQIPLITADSDLPAGSKRLCYIGTDNVEAGRAAGELVKEAMPEGGKLVIYVGKLDVQNAQERRQGVIDALKAEGGNPQAEANVGG